MMKTAKTLLSYVRNGTAVLHLDNQKRGVPFGGPAGDSLQPQQEAGGRVLMTLTCRRAVNRMIVTVTGKFDSIRWRHSSTSMPHQLLTTQDRPHDGRVFKHDALLEYI